MHWNILSAMASGDPQPRVSARGWARSVTFVLMLRSVAFVVLMPLGDVVGGVEVVARILVPVAERVDVGGPVLFSRHLVVGQQLDDLRRLGQNRPND